MSKKYEFISAVLLFVAAQVSCSAQSKADAVNVPSQNASSNRDGDSIKRIWEKKRDSLSRQSKNINRDRLNLMLEILNAATDGERDAEFARFSRESWGYITLNEYDQILLQALVARAIEKRNEGELGALISHNVPRRVGSISIELYLATRHPEKLMILFRGIENAASDPVKQDIIHILDCVFPDLRRSAKNDEEFILAAKAWYTRNADRAVNTFYEPCSSWPDRQTFFKAESK